MILGSFALACIITVLIYFLMKSIANFEIAQLFSFTIGFIGGGGLLASLVFAYFGDAANGASFLTLTGEPVSQRPKSAGCALPAAV
jgi:hypothetical protein